MRVLACAYGVLIRAYGVLTRAYRMSCGQLKIVYPPASCLVHTLKVGAGLLPFMGAILPFMETMLPCMETMLPFMEAILPFTKLPFMATILPFMEAILSFMEAILPEVGAIAAINGDKTARYEAMQLLWRRFCRVKMLFLPFTVATLLFMEAVQRFMEAVLSFMEEMLPFMEGMLPFMEVIPTFPAAGVEGLGDGGMIREVEYCAETWYAPMRPLWHARYHLCTCYGMFGTSYGPATFCPVSAMHPLRQARSLKGLLVVEKVPTKENRVCWHQGGKTGPATYCWCYKEYR